MNPSEQCPEPGMWKTFLDGELLDEASADLTAHLEECEACQQTLERLAAGKETWEGTAKQLAEADANAEQLESSEHLRDVLNDLKQGIEIDSRAANITPESLTFLSESDEEDSIGRLGSYEVLEIVGAGGMGIVMRAWDPSLRRIVAIKVLASHLANSAAARRRFVREAQAAAAVSHDHVVAIHAVEADHEPPYLVMQYIEGKTLQQRLDGVGPLHVREVLRIGQQTALGLSAAHQQGIVHRDIKPANILLENGVERVRITDFGLARAIDDASMTQSGVVAGTPLFMAPEQAQGIQLDHRADLFSLGSVLYVMCTGRPPFRSSTMIGVIRRVCDDSPRPIREINPDIPEWLCAIIDRLLAKAPQDRYASADEVAELLGSCLAHVQQPTIVSLPAEIASAASSDEGRTDHETMVKGEVAIASVGIVGPELEKPDSPESQHELEVRLPATIPVTPASIRREVFWPAAIMITAGVTNFLVACGTVIYLIDHIDAGIAQHLSARIVGILPPALIVYGSLRMMRLQSRVWGIVAAIVCLVSGPCYPLSWPASIWALAVLMRPHVQREFSRISNERRQPDIEPMADDQLIPGEFRPLTSIGQKLARVFLLAEASIAGAVIPFSGVLAFTLEGPDWIPRRFVIAMTGLVLAIAVYVALALYRYGFESCSEALKASRARTFRRKLRSPALWARTLAGAIPCLLITADINATTYNDFLSGAVLPLTLVGAVLLIVGAVLNLNRAQSDHHSGQTVDHPAFALLGWPTPMLAILWTAFVAWSDFQGTVGYVRFQIDDHNSWVSLTSDDSQIDLKRRSGWRKLRVPEGKYYWTVSDAGLDTDHAVNGTVDIESPRTSVVNAKVHGDGALESCQYGRNVEFTES
jgi:serine/threonine-protein kinase